MMHGLAAKDFFRFEILSSHFYRKPLKIEVSNKKTFDLLSHKLQIKKNH